MPRSFVRTAVLAAVTAGALVGGVAAPAFAADAPVTGPNSALCLDLQSQASRADQRVTNQQAIADRQDARATARQQVADNQDARATAQQAIADANSDATDAAGIKARDDARAAVQDAIAKRDAARADVQDAIAKRDAARAAVTAATAVRDQARAAELTACAAPAPTTTPETTSPPVVPVPRLVVGNGIPDRDCADFATQADAQRFFVANGGSALRNVDNLDANHNGVACEDHFAAVGTTNINNGVVVNPTADDGSDATTSGTQVTDVPSGSAQTGAA